MLICARCSKNVDIIPLVFLFGAPEDAENLQDTRVALYIRRRRTHGVSSRNVNHNTQDLNGEVFHELLRLYLRPVLSYRIQPEGKIRGRRTVAFLPRASYILLFFFFSFKRMRILKFMKSNYAIAIKKKRATYQSCRKNFISRTRENCPETPSRIKSRNTDS